MKIFRPRVETNVRVDEFGNCPDKKGPIYFNESGVAPWGKTSVGYGTAIAERTQSNLHQVKFNIINL